MSQDSKTFCVYPWAHQLVLPPGTIGYCCVAKEGGPVLKKDGNRLRVPAATLSEAWNSDYQRDVRKKMLNGESLSACQLCYYQESIGKNSYRQMHNQEWLEKERAEIESRIDYSRNHDFAVKDGALYLDLRLGNLCNLKCRMCNPHNSTKIAAETEGLLKSDVEFKAVYAKYYGEDAVRIPKWYEDQTFWDGIYSQLGSLKKVYLTGGEPTLIKKNYEFLKKCVDSGHSKHIFLMFNINCTNLTDEFLSYLEHFEFVLVNASIDGFKSVNEYIRGSSDWDVVSANFFKLLRAKGPLQIGVTPTIQVYNVLSITDLLEYVERVSLEAGKSVNLDFLYVTDPPYLDIRILSPSIRQIALGKVLAYLAKSSDFVNSNKYLKNSLDSLVNALRSTAPANMEKLAEFAQYTKSLDRARGENFNVSLPVLSHSLASEGICV